MGKSYEVFESLLKEKGKTATDVSRETGIPRSNFTDWKKGRSTPKTENLQKIADYFGVSLETFTSKDSSRKKYVIKMPRFVPTAVREKELEAKEAMLELINKEIEKGIDCILRDIFSDDCTNNEAVLNQMILTRYHEASPGTQAAIRKLLDIEETDNLLPIAAHAKDGATLEELQEDAEMLNQYPNKKGEEL